MKIIEKNIGRHENGNLYFVIRRNGKLIRQSLGTTDLNEAKKKIREIGILGFVTAHDPVVPAPAPVPVAAELIAHDAKEVKEVAVTIDQEKMTIADALKEHHDDLILLADGTREMADRTKRVIEKFCKKWEDFDPVKVWKAYRATGIKRQGEELGSAANHLRTYMRSFVPWAEKRGLLGENATESLAKIPMLRVNSRMIRVPSISVVREFFAMVEGEDPDGAAFLRFLASTGLRRTAAATLEWSMIDFVQGEMTVKMKRGKIKVIPMTPEAIAVLQGRPVLLPACRTSAGSVAR